MRKLGQFGLWNGPRLPVLMQLCVHTVVELGMQTYTHNFAVGVRDKLAT